MHYTSYNIYAVVINFINLLRQNYADFSGIRRYFEIGGLISEGECILGTKVGP